MRKGSKKETEKNYDKQKWEVGNNVYSYYGVWWMHISVPYLTKNLHPNLDRGYALDPILS